jgi:deoxyribodipyrimidine photo-lyase
VTAAALVWFKRDLRLRDHAPLALAQARPQSLALFIIEPAWLQSPECHPRHVAYTLQCLAQTRHSLAQRGLPLLVRVGEATQVLGDLRREFVFDQLLSHEETGTGWSYTRDIAVAGWCRHHGVQWTELPQTGVVRRLRSRSGWAARWARRMDAPEATVLGDFTAPAGFALSEQPRLPSLADLGQPGTALSLPTAGEPAAWQALNSFLAGRGRDYRRGMSSPISAATSCSRLSEHLAFGSISMRSVHQATVAAQQRGDPGMAHALRSFAGRQRWHCHFMQKLEDEPAIEWRNFARSHDGLRAGDGVNTEAPDRLRLQAWCEGQTGYPMVDACMRQLRATGWLNFRMRALLVSFAAYHLWLHWREPGLHLARQFLDFEPGIHWSQMQMQSGTTGINTLRIYSPSKQALDQDPAGDYVRRWVPELGTPAYPQPIVCERLALATAKERLYGLRSASAARHEAQAIQQQHGSRKSGLPRTDSGKPSKAAGASGAGRRPRPATAPGQGELF